MKAPLLDSIKTFPNGFLGDDGNLPVDLELAVEVAKRLNLDWPCSLLCGM